MFFDNSWRGHRGRNTFILFFVLVFVFGISPVPPGTARAADSELRIMVREIIRDRLARIYGGRDKIPRMSSRIARGYQTLEPPKSGTGTIIRGAFLYLLPSDVQHKADGIWTRAARVMDGIIGANEAKAVTPASRGHLRPQDACATRRHLSPGPAHRGSRVGGPDTPVGRTMLGHKGNAIASFLEPQTSNPKPQTSLSAPGSWLLATGYSFLNRRRGGRGSCGVFGTGRPSSRRRRRRPFQAPVRGLHRPGRKRPVPAWVCP